MIKIFDESYRLKAEVEVMNAFSGHADRSDLLDYITKIKDLKKHPKNPRQLNKDQEKHLSHSIDKFGLIDKPIVTIDGLIIGGHQRINVLKKQKIKEIECWIPDQELTERDIDELNIRLNKNTGDWDYDILADQWEVNDLLEWGFTEEELTGAFDEIETIEAEDESEVLEPGDDKDATTQLGDIYELNGHRLICGDSTLPDVVNECFNGEIPILMVTDPPYNLASENSMVAAGSNNKMAGKLKNSSWDKNFDMPEFLKCIQNLLPENISVYIFTSHHLAGIIWEWSKDWASHYSWCVWKKSNPMPSLMKRHWTWDAELICYATRGKHIFNFPEEGHAHSTFEFSKVSSCDLHPTMKPVELICHIISHSSNKNNIVLDPFLGSGTTLIAAEQLGRICYGIELSPSYCDIIVNRWKKFMEKNNKPYSIKRNGEVFNG